MSKSKSKGPQPAKIKDVMFSSDEICFIFKDSRRVVLPRDHEIISTLASADFQQRSKFELLTGGETIVWPALELILTANEIIAAAQ